MLRATLLAFLLAPLGCSTNPLPATQSTRLGASDGGNPGGPIDLGHGDGGGCDNGGGVDLAGPVDGGWPLDAGPIWLDGGWPVDAGHPHDAGHHPVDLAQ